MVAWVAMVPLFWTVILFLVREGVIDSPLRLAGFFDRAYERAWLWILMTDLIMAAIIVVRFWSYWPALWN
jgi:hypothetical protein